MQREKGQYGGLVGGGRGNLHLLAYSLGTDSCRDWATLQLKSFLRLAGTQVCAPALAAPPVSILAGSWSQKLSQDLRPRVQIWECLNCSANV